MGKVFNKELKEDENQERLLKRLKNIEDKNKEQSDENEYQEERLLDMINKHGIKQWMINIIQLKKSKNQKKPACKNIEKEEKLSQIMLLKDNLNDILMT